MERLEPSHAIFDSVEGMLDRVALSELLGAEISFVRLQPNSDHDGNAGSDFAFVVTDAGHLVLKTMSIDSDWEMYATDDHACRSVTLWQYGLLDRSRPRVDAQIVAAARDEDGYAC